MKQITIPKKLAPLIKAFSVDDQAAKLLIIEAATATLGSSEVSYATDISNEELEGVIALMRGIDPRDTLEMIYGAQIIASHLMGLRLLSHSYTADKVLGLKLLHFSNESMLNLQKKRMGGINQNITITHNHVGPGPTLIQNQIPKDERCQ